MSQDSKPNLDLINNLLYAAKTSDKTRQVFKPLKDFLCLVQKNKVSETLPLEYLQKAFALYGKMYVRKIHLLGKEIQQVTTTDATFERLVDDYYFLLKRKHIPAGMRTNILSEAVHFPKRLGEYIVTNGKKPSRMSFTQHVRICAYQKAWRMLVRMNNRYLASERELRITAASNFINAANKQTGLKLDGNTPEVTIPLIAEGVTTIVEHEITFISHGWGNQHHFSRSLTRLRPNTSVDIQDVYIERLINILLKHRDNETKPEVVIAQIYQYLVGFKLNEKVRFTAVAEIFKRFSEQQNELSVKDFFSTARIAINELIADTPT